MTSDQSPLTTEKLLTSISHTLTMPESTTYSITTSNTMSPTLDMSTVKTTMDLKSTTGSSTNKELATTDPISGVFVLLKYCAFFLLCYEHFFV